MCIYCLCMAGYANIRSRVWHNDDSLKKKFRELVDTKETEEEGDGKAGEAGENIELKMREFRFEKLKN